MAKKFTDNLLVQFLLDLSWFQDTFCKKMLAPEAYEYQLKAILNGLYHNQESFLYQFKDNKFAKTKILKVFNFLFLSTNHIKYGELGQEKQEALRKIR